MGAARKRLDLRQTVAGGRATVKVPTPLRQARGSRGPEPIRHSRAQSVRRRWRAACSSRAAMSTGIWSAASGAVGQVAALDTAAQNIANATTPGFRAEEAVFRQTLVKSVNKKI